MSTVNVSCGSARNSSHVHVGGSSTSPSIVNVQSSVAVRGVGPADSTGKSSTTYWPGGMRDVSMSRRGRPRKPRETKAMAQTKPSGRHAHVVGVGEQTQERLAELVLDDAALVVLARDRDRRLDQEAERLPRDAQV